MQLVGRALTEITPEHILKLSLLDFDEERYFSTHAVWPFRA